MNRSKLLFSALLLSGAMAAPALASHTSQPAAPSAARRSATSVPNRQTHSEAKCGRCGSIGGKGPASRTTARNGPAAGKKGPETGHLQPGRGVSGKNDRIRDMHTREMDVHHDREGARQRRIERPDHSVLVASRGGHGYIQRSYSFHGREFDHRTYYYHGVPYSRVYQRYEYRGIALHVYAPGFYYPPAFYGWVYAPWARPVAWEWGWAGNPWYRYYGAWFRPYPVYTSPSLWLTDYLVAQTLEAAYEERTAAARRSAQAADFAASPMQPAVKQAIAEEVRRQLALENAEARSNSQNPPDPGSSGLARMLNDGISHVFVVATGLDVRSGGGECSITEGDVIQLNGPTPPNSVTANLVVLASKGNDCPRGSVVTVGLADLQEMQNHMRETIDRGLGELQQKQGNSGLPAPPPAALKPPVQTEFAAIAPPPDPNGEAEIRQQAAEADKVVRK